MVTTKLNLSMTEPQVRQIYAKQGDTGRVLDITLDQTPEDGTLRILRPDGVEVTSEAVTGGEVESGGTFESLTEADVTELTVGIDPVQDLNGYDKPWVGGAGKNKFDVSSYDLTSQWTNVSGVITNAGNPLSGNYIGCSFSGRSTTTLSAGTYILSLKARLVSGEYTGGTFNALRLHTNGTDIKDFQRVSNPRISNVFQTYYGVITLEESYTFEDMNLQFSTGLSNAVFEIKEIQIELGSTPTAWQPYSNICPITGHDEVRVTRTGKNLLDVSLGQYKALNSTTGELGADNPIRFTSALTDLPDGTYTFSFGSNMFVIGIAFYDKSGNFKRYDVKNFSTTAQTFSAEREKIRLYCGSAQNHDDLVNGLSVGQLELGSTATTYEPYQGSTYTTSLGQTVYGGTLDMVTGVLTVDRGFYTVTDVAEIVGNGSKVGTYPKWLLAINSLPNVDPSYYGQFWDRQDAAICNMGVMVRESVSLNTDETTMSVYFHTNNMEIRLRPLVSEFPTLEEAKQVYVGAEFVYPVTPTTYQLTPQQIKTLVGTNNVWASSGDIVNIKFAYGGLLSELPSDATEIVGKCYCDVEQNGVSSMPFTLNVKKNERES